MNLGFDLDKIFIDYPPFIPGSLIDRLYKRQANGMLLYRIPSYPEQLLRKLSHHHMFRPPMRENISFLKHLSSKKHNLYLISSRFGFLEKMTVSIINRYDIEDNFKELFFNFKNLQPHFFKDRILSRVTLDRYVDDDLPLIKYLASRHKRVQFYWLNKKAQKKIHPNITAITTLSKMVP